MLRRRVLQGMSALPAAAMLPRTARAAGPPTSAIDTTGLAVTDDTVTVGILHSITGTMAISETGSVEAEKLAISRAEKQHSILADFQAKWQTVRRKIPLFVKSI